jgi:hypothetical protein
VAETYRQRNKLGYNIHLCFDITHPSLIYISINFARPHHAKSSRDNCVQLSRLHVSPILFSHYCKVITCKCKA